ncbi:hypothetical protein K458DRAFT_417838 [Lentithecium fluviatile CBS 122367]|uniref:Chromo domain-containing protein n=1 Tax=Lentithecium fluviatile CBS 122367 TaxID=1168545 RepID=A0A6G1J3L4_9PLEO|nr:hypothetical protein K458DRAFT_417838 [Lentithecium fluviatile CBS 122367]
MWEWEAYKPGPEVYNNLWRLREAPPVITQTLPDECPIPNAQSRILNRRTTEDEYCRLYYNVHITYLPSKDASSGDGKGREETVPVDLSRILKYVSRRELSRFENAEARAEAEAVAVVARAEAEELAKRRLEKNARVAGVARGSRMLNGLGLDPEVRTRGRPRGRGRRGMPRGGWPGRGGLAAQANEMADDLVSEDVKNAKPLEAPDREDELLQQMTAETSEEEEDEQLAKPPSPDLRRSSLIVNSALPASPLAAYRSLPKPFNLRRGEPDVDDIDTKDDTQSMQSAAVQLQFEGDIRGRSGFESEESEQDRHRTKRRRTESTSHSRPPAGAPSKQMSTLAHNLSKNLVTEMPQSSSEESFEENDTISVQRPATAHSTNKQPAHRSRPTYQDDDPEDDEEQEDEEPETEEYVIEAILDHSYQDDTKYYLVKWQGYADSSDWVSAEDLAGAPEMVAEYEDMVRRKKEKGRMAIR